MKTMCKLFGHKWILPDRLITGNIRVTCARGCGSVRYLHKKKVEEELENAEKK
jgi:hypothetical protein